MPPPTHGEYCQKRRCYPTRCKICDEEIFYWECTCGSKVFFDELGEPWPIHKCIGSQQVRNPRKLKRPKHHLAQSDKQIQNRQQANTVTKAVIVTTKSLVKCPICGVDVRNDRLERHEAKVHQINFSPQNSDLEKLNSAESNVVSQLTNSGGVRFSYTRRKNRQKLTSKSYRRKQNRLDNVVADEIILETIGNIVGENGLEFVKKFRVFVRDKVSPNAILKWLQILKSRNLEVNIKNLVAVRAEKMESEIARRLRCPSKQHIGYGRATYTNSKRKVWGANKR